MILKSWRTFHYIYKPCSNILSNRSGSSKRQMGKNGKKYQKYAEIRDVKILQKYPFNLEIIQ